MSDNNGEAIKLIFDQYQRYRIVADIINKYRSDGETFRILDIGAGFLESLKKFLPSDDVYFMDREYPPEYAGKHNYISGDITQTTISGEYDFIISIDTYEHIDAGHRAKFIDSITRLSKVATILAAPFDIDNISIYENCVNELYRYNHGEEYRWLQEHIHNGLPSLDATVKQIKEAGFDCTILPNGYLPRWLEMISFYLWSEDKPEVWAMTSRIYEYYNLSFYDYDNREPAYRHVIVVNKSSKYPNLKELCREYPEPDGQYENYETLKSLIMNVKESYNIRFSQDRVKAAELRIKELEGELRQKTLESNAMGLNMAKLSQEQVDLNNVIDRNKFRMVELNDAIDLNNVRINELNSELENMKQSVVWRLVMTYHNGFIERLMPHETRRRKAYDGMIRSLRALVNEGPLGFRKKHQQHKKDKAAASTSTSRFTKTVENTILPYWRGRPITSTPLISIIIVTYNSSRFIEDAIDSIVNQKYPLDSIELVIVDNGSKDGTADKVYRNIDKYKDKLHIHFIDTKKNNGFGKGVNIGVKSASENARYVLLVNPDCQLYQNTIEELVSAAQATLEHNYRLWECRQMPYEHPKHYSPVTLETSWSSGACCLIHKETFEKIGGFDQNIFLYMEDVDLSWRIRMNGYQLMYVPFAKVRHDTYDEARQVKSTQYYNSVLYGLYLRLKYGSLSDIRWYCRQYTGLIKNTPNHLPHERRTLIRQLARLLILVPKALFFRLVAHKKLKEFKPQFMAHDFEYCREGAFVKSDIDIEKEKILPKVSIVVRTMGRKGFLREALTSIRNQTYGNVETIVIEDGPTTVKDMLENEFGSMDIKYYALGERRGRCRAGNVGLSKCTGKYLRFLDDDDLLYPTSIETAVYFMLKDDGNYQLAYDLSFEVPTKVISEDPLKYEERDYKLVYNQDFDPEIILHHNFIPIQNVLFDRELYERFGGFDEDLDALEDWDLWIRYSHHTGFLKIPKVTSLYRVPAEKSDIEKRQVKLDGYYHVVKEKHMPRRSE